MTKRSFDVEHVLMTADAVGGVWTYCLDLARGLARHGVRVTLATMGPEPTPRQCEEARQIPGLDLHTSTYKLEWMHEPWADVDAAGDWLLSLAERIRPDVIHLNGYAHAALPWPAPTMVVCHSDVLSWWQAVKGSNAPMDEWSEYARRVGEGLHAAGLVVAPTAAVLSEVQRNYGRLDAARVIHNGRNGAEFAPAAKRSLVFSAGRFWDEAKNLSALQSVAPRLDWPVYIAGEVGEHRPRGTEINFLGRLCPSAISAWLGRAGIYALPAKYEPFGLSALEAALSGCALVLGDIPSLRELWDGAALFVNPDAPEDLERAIQSLTQDDRLRHEMAARAGERAKDYTVGALACSTLFAYQDLVQTNLLDLSVFTHPGVSLQ
jgi:glycosyltransferase involved in cell wall biosynthesis